MKRVDCALNTYRRSQARQVLESSRPLSAQHQIMRTNRMSDLIVFFNPCSRAFEWT